MSKELEISFTQFRNYRLCPKRYKADIDRTHPPQTEQEQYNVAFGKIMGKLAEDFYKGQLFMKLTDPAGLREVFFKLKDRVPILVNKFLRNVTLEIKGRPLSKEEWNDRCVTALKRFLASVVENRLYGVYTNAEIVLKIRIAKYGITLTGRPDLAVVSEASGQPRRAVIVDFKSRPSKSVAVAQLAWYALLWYYKFGEVPTEVGFLYFEPADGIPVFQSYKFTDADLRKIMGEILQVRDKILADGHYRAKANDQCWNCGLSKICPTSPFYKEQAAVAALKTSDTKLTGMSLAPDAPKPVVLDEVEEGSLSDFSGIFE